MFEVSAGWGRALVERGGGAARAGVVALLVLVPLLGVAPVQAQSNEVSVAGFDTAGLEAVVLASFDAGGATETLWSSSGSPWGASGTLVGG